MLYFDMTDADLTSLMIWREARDQSDAGRLGVLSVARNRVGRPGFAKTIRDVILQKSQFSSFNVGNSQSTLFPSASNPIDFKAWNDIRAMVAANPPDNVKGANFYHDASIPPPAVQWLGKGRTVDDLIAKRTARIGKLRFYRL